MVTEKAAEYLAEVQWKKNDERENGEAPHDFCNFNNGKLKMNHDMFYMDEIIYVLNKFKNNKAPGPDFFRADFVKIFDEVNRKHLLNMINKVYNEAKLEEHLHNANVVPIKKSR